MSETSTFQSSTGPGGQTINEWTHDVPMGLSSYWLIPPEQRPRQVKVGRSTLILEPARDWLERMHKLGGVKFKRYPKRGEVA